ncbi:MAG: isochorismatase family protein [Granulosicoccus sp.]
MHRTEIRADIRERILARRGRPFIHEHIEAARLALVVVDMQNAFVDPDKPSAVPEARNIVPNINRLASAVRDAGGSVAWVYTTFTPATLVDWNAFFGGVYSETFSRAVIDNLCAGSDGHLLWHELAIADNDLRISKDRFSAFLPGACELDTQLRARQIDTVIISGTVTNVCCESSARDALMRNFNVIMAHDANAALSDADHNTSMNAIAQTFGDVMSIDEVIDRLQTDEQAPSETDMLQTGNTRRPFMNSLD